VTSLKRDARRAVVCAVVIAAIVAGCARRGGGPEPVAGVVPAGSGPPAVGERHGGRAAASATAVEPLSARSREQVERFCGDCHRLPLAGSFPRGDWPREVRQGFDFYLASLRTDLPRPAEGDAIRYFQQTAPERIVVPRAADRVEQPAPVTFVAVADLAGADTVDPAIAQVMLVGGNGEPGGCELLTTDMRSGEIRRWTLSATGATHRVLARLAHPCRVSPLRPGGGTDRIDAWVVGELGSFLPEDHDHGGVYRLWPSGGGPQAGQAGDVEGLAPLRLGLGRVVEAVPFDYDGDGRRDLIVAEFGWRTTGALRILDGAAEETGGGEAASGETVLDARHGVLDVRVADLDADGRDDVVAAFAQEHETVDAWFAMGDGKYEHRELFRGEDPSWGSSGFDLADMDGDGDLDILHANGDTMDTGLARPEHGIRILFNEGQRRFRSGEIARMPGVSQATPADLDGDGDLDVVAAALHPGAAAEAPGTFDSLLWVEQAEGGEWRTHSIERDRCQSASLALADVDGDGRPDIVAGSWLPGEQGTSSPALRLWLNRPPLP